MYNKRLKGTNLITRIILHTSTGLSAVYVGGSRTSRYRLPCGSSTKRITTMPRPTWTSIWIYMRIGKADKSSHATPFGRTGKKGRQTCVTGYCARCKSCLLFNKNNIQPSCTIFEVKAILIDRPFFFSNSQMDLICISYRIIELFQSQSFDYISFYAENGTLGMLSQVLYNSSRAWILSSGLTEWSN